MPKNNRPEDTHAGAKYFCDLVRPLLNPSTRQHVLVAGCGEGHEALHIHQSLGVDVIGVDVDRHWGPEDRREPPGFALVAGNVLSLEFPDDSFDFVFYHHVIEHIGDPAKSLQELARVLKPGGLIYIGTPNRNRAVGYLGARGVPAREKLQWNIADYKARLKGRFRNEFGAHAGFSEKELSRLLQPCFTDIEVLTADYIVFKYGGRLPSALLRALSARPIVGVTAASAYLVARKPHYALA